MTRGMVLEIVKEHRDRIGHIRMLNARKTRLTIMSNATTRNSRTADGRKLTKAKCTAIRRRAVIELKELDREIDKAERGFRFWSNEVIA